MKYKYIYNSLVVFAALLVCSSCNNKLDEEQYEQYISFKAPTSNSTVAQIRLKYRGDTIVHYKLPLIVSGTTGNTKDLDVHVGIDSDTLRIYNHEHFYEREDLYFKQMEFPLFEIPNSVVHITAGQSSGLMDIQFNLKGLDLSDKWLLPLVVEDDPSYNYKSHPRLGYNNALLWITPFNDYSGEYGTTNLSVYTENSDKPIVESKRTAHVVNENSVFFYAGVITENRKDRRFFKIIATFTPTSEEEGTITLTSENPELKLEVIGQPIYKIKKEMDNERPTLLRKTTTISNLEYKFEDPLETPGYTLKYKAKGSMSLQRNINTAIPDEEYAIEWE